MADASATPVPWRWELDPATGTSTEGRLFEGAVDFPQVDARRVGRAQQIHYGLYFHEHSEPAVAQPLGVVKSLRGGALTRWTPGAGQQPDEALFVPFGAAEDDGYLLSMVFDAARARSYVAVLDATAIERGPLAKVWMPRRVPFGFHGTWLPTG
jgi:carotenoid cleavage dioxygenase